MRFPAAVLSALIVFLVASVRAGDSLKVWVDLRDKGAVSSAVGERAYEDAPVHAPYLERLRAAGLRVSVVLKWQNKVSGWVDPAGLEAVKILPFVKGVEALPRKAPGTRPRRDATGLSKAQGAFGAFDSVFIKSGAGFLRDTLAARGALPGEGLRIAVMDENFHLGHQAFDSLFSVGGIVDQWDFVDGTSAAVDRHLTTSHGAQVLSPIASNAPGTAVGLAPHARYLLYRTESEGYEDPVEEDFLAAALERAVDSGAQVINVSLGYRFDFDTLAHTPYAAMDGRTRPASIAAVGAARRGALVIVAIGNEGGSRGGTPTISSPSDADSILSVGMIAQSGTWCSYSSTGPSFDGRLKPELAALGCGMTVINPSSPTGMTTAFGTSVGAPVITGIAALLRQLHPAAPSQKIRGALMTTGSRSAAPDSLVGNGLVRAGQAHCALLLDSLVQTPCPPPVPRPPSKAVKGVFVWRGGDVAPLPWPTDLDLSRPRLWDLRGRPQRIESFLDTAGTVQLRSRQRFAPGAYILRIPPVRADSLP